MPAPQAEAWRFRARARQTGPAQARREPGERVRTLFLKGTIDVLGRSANMRSAQPCTRRPVHRLLHSTPLNPPVSAALLSDGGGFNQVRRDSGSAALIPTNSAET
jgi:hypothetical protein